MPGATATPAGNGDGWRERLADLLLANSDVGEDGSHDLADEMIGLMMSAGWQPPSASGNRVTVEQVRAAVEAHEPSEGITQWYVDERCIDCDAEEFWAVIAAVLSDDHG